MEDFAIPVNIYAEQFFIDEVCDFKISNEGFLFIPSALSYLR